MAGQAELLEAGENYMMAHPLPSWLGLALMLLACAGIGLYWAVILRVLKK